MIDKTMILVFGIAVGVITDSCVVNTSLESKVKHGIPIVINDVAYYLVKK